MSNESHDQHLNAPGHKKEDEATGRDFSGKKAKRKAARAYLYELFGALLLWGGFSINHFWLSLLPTAGGLACCAAGIRVALENFNFRSRTARNWGWAFVVVGAAVWMAMKLPPEGKDDSPSLAPTLVIDAVSDTEVSYRYELLNNGMSSAYNILCDEYGQGSRWTEMKPPLNWTMTELRAGEKMNIAITPYSWKREGRFFSKVLSLSWTDSKTNRFHRRFRFFGDEKSLRPNALFQFSNSSPDHQVEDIEETLRTSLETPEGDIFFVFAETNADGRAVNCFLQSTNRFLNLDGGTRTVSFWSVGLSNQIEKASLVIKTNKQSVHVISIHWGPEGCSIWLDGETNSSPSYSE